jgi:hypothetical protein
MVERTGRRGRGAAWLVVIAVVLSMLALALAYSGRAILRSGPFADRVVATLRDPAVQDDVADHVTNAITESGNGDLVALRPLVRAITGSIVSSGPFAALFRLAAVASTSESPSTGEPKLGLGGRWPAAAPSSPRAAIARSLLLIAAGVVIVLEPVQVLTVAMIGIGIWIVYTGIARQRRRPHRSRGSAQAGARCAAGGEGGGGSG